MCVQLATLEKRLADGAVDPATFVNKLAAARSKGGKALKLDGVSETSSPAGGR